MDDATNEEIDFNPLETIPRQQALLREYCAGVEDRIKTAPSESGASNLVEGLCRKFDSECESEVLRSGVRTYLSELIQRYWGKSRNS
jgi:hypothetical protein